MEGFKLLFIVPRRIERKNAIIRQLHVCWRRLDSKILFHQWPARNVGLRKPLPIGEIGFRDVLVPDLMSDIRVPEYAARGNVGRARPDRYRLVLMDQHDEFVMTNPGSRSLGLAKALDF